MGNVWEIRERDGERGTYSHVHAHTHTCNFTFTHTCMQFHIHTHTHTHTHTYIQTDIHTRYILSEPIVCFIKRVKRSTTSGYNLHGHPCPLLPRHLYKQWQVANLCFYNKEVHINNLLYHGKVCQKSPEKPIA